MDGLWDITIPVKSDTKKTITAQIYQAPSTPKTSVIIRKHQTKVALATYHHHTLFAPTEKLFDTPFVITIFCRGQD